MKYRDIIFVPVEDKDKIDYNSSVMFMLELINDLVEYEDEPNEPYDVLRIKVTTTSNVNLEEANYLRDLLEETLEETMNVEEEEFPVKVEFIVEE